MARKRLISARDLVRQARARAERRLFEKAVGDLADRAPADRADAGDREQIGDQRVRALRIGAGERRQHALIFRPLLRGDHREAFEVVRQIALAVEVLHQPALPRRREFERADQRGEQADVAGADVGLGEAVVAGRFERERQHLGVGGRGVGAAERFDAGLQDLARAFVAMAEHRSEIAIALRLAGRRRGQVVARHRDGQVGPQAQLLAVRVAGEEHALADVLARKVEERLRRLQDRGRDPRIAGPLEGRDQRVRRGIGAGSTGRHGRHGDQALGRRRSSMVRGLISTPNRRRA